MFLQVEHPSLTVADSIVLLLEDVPVRLGGDSAEHAESQEHSHDKWAKEFSVQQQINVLLAYLSPLAGSRPLPPSRPAGPTP